MPIKKVATELRLCYNHNANVSGLVVKRLRRRPLTAQSRVRFPAGSPDEGYTHTPREKPDFRFLFLLRFVRPHSRFRRFRRDNRGKSSSIKVLFSARLYHVSISRQFKPVKICNRFATFWGYRITRESVTAVRRSTPKRRRNYKNSPASYQCGTIFVLILKINFEYRHEKIFLLSDDLERLRLRQAAGVTPNCS